MPKNNNISAITEMRLLAHQALLQNLLRCWGQPADALMSNLRRTEEAMVVSALNQGAQDWEVDLLRSEFQVAIRSLADASRNPPDDRPDPVG